MSRSVVIRKELKLWPGLRINPDTKGMVRERVRVKIDNTSEEQGLLRKLDRDTRRERAVRLMEVNELFPIGDGGIIIGGGPETFFALQEATTAYVNELWIAAVLTSLAAIERHIASNLHFNGLASAKRMNVQKLLERAEAADLVTAEMQAEIGKLREARNAYAHFREPEIWVARFRERSAERLYIYQMLEQDAKLAIRLVTAYFRRNQGII